MTVQQGVKPEDSSPQSAAQDPTQNTQFVPKERLDELISRTRELQGQNQVLQHLLRQAVPAQGQPQAQPEPERLKRLKEEDPELYQLIKTQEVELKQTRAMSFQMNEDLERDKFLRDFADAGAAERIGVVEQKLQELRARGIFHFNRGQILLHMLGVEAVQGKRGRPAQPNTPQIPATPQAHANAQPPQAQQGGASTTILIANAPGTDPSAAGVPSGSSAPAQARQETIEEMEARLATTVF